ncbi:Rv0909 family putative TA system antitoxin [Kribbella sp. CWNU-51]
MLNERWNNTPTGKTGGQYGDKIDQGTDMAKDQLDNLDGQDDDIE